MIKFFRKIRQHLLTENNFSKPASPVGRYLFYAIGEIVLVVIGILIALQINNWNTNRIERTIEKDYIRRLAKELSDEIDYYKNVRDQFINKEKSLNRIVMVWQSNPSILNDSLQYINDFKSAGDISTWYSEPIAWNQLIQSGDLKFIKNQEIIDALFTYFNEVKKIADNYQMHPMELTNKGREAWQYPFKDENPEVLFQSLSSEFVKKPNDIVFERMWNKRTEYLELFMPLAYSCRRQHFHIQNNIDSGQLLLEQLKSYK